MRVINVRNVHRALPEGLRHLQVEGIRDGSRFGDVVVAPTPVTTVYQRPWERVLFWALRDANPFFHLFEALYFLAGRNDVEWLAYYNDGMRKFSDDGKTFHGSYGYRWRKHFQAFTKLEKDEPGVLRWANRNLDQLDTVVQLLKNKPRTRRAIIQMWDCKVDLYPDEYPQHRDLPCNDLIAVWLDRDDCLCMTVFCRSNDIIWGCYGSNAVHFSVLQEYLAARVGVEIGPMYQVSNNFHAYTDLYEKMLPLADEASDGYKSTWCPYKSGLVLWTKIITDAHHFDAELIDSFMCNLTPKDGWRNEFFPHVAIPMRRAYRLFKEEPGIERYQGIYEILGQIDPRSDWGRACISWMHSREVNARAKSET